ncbi:MAG: protocatechuate 3,4-dioxygenase subunit alpha [Marinovum sp.]|nr:protocatechuate 3,4-dioxygenase subunit alpha [Marinovum sp.]
MANPQRPLPETASQTAGPYVHIGLSPRAAGFEIYEVEPGQDIAGPNAKGTPVEVTGIVWDGNGDPVRDVLLEVWQPNTHGAFAHTDDVEPGFRGWGRVICDFDTGEWSFKTIKPGSVARADGGTDAPALALWIVARGINIGLQTRMYFPDETETNAVDPAMGHVPEDRRGTLIAQRTEDTDPTRLSYRFDIRLQGDGETVFFDI